jgi:hypothetical protein
MTASSEASKVPLKVLSIGPLFGLFKQYGIPNLTFLPSRSALHARNYRQTTRPDFGKSVSAPSCSTNY